MKLRIITLGIVLLTLLELHAEAKYIFYFIGDGMGIGHVTTTNTYLREKGIESPLLMTTFPYSTFCTTQSASSPITDSAAAGTALSTGVKTVNSRIAMTPDSLSVASVAQALADAGYGVGVATSVALDDATPAAFYAHALGRHDSANIAPYATNSYLSFLGGGGSKISHTDAWDKWREDMLKAGFSPVSSTSDFHKLDKKETRKILMMPEYNIHDQIGYTIDSVAGKMHLSELTSACLETMKRSHPERFFMMIEGGNIDWAAHANDGAAVIKEIINFQESISQAYDFLKSHPDETLIIVTADHDTGGMALGREDNRSNPNLSLVDYQHFSKDLFNEYLKQYAAKDPEPPVKEDFMRLLEDKFSLGSTIKLTDAEKEELDRSFNATFIDRNSSNTDTWYQSFNDYAMKLFNILNRHYGIGWTSTSHTGNPVPVYAVGAGAENFSHLLDNTDIPKLILKAANLDTK